MVKVHKQKNSQSPKSKKWSKAIIRKMVKVLKQKNGQSP